MITVKCRSCPASIVWLWTKKDKKIPVNAETVQEGDLLYDHTRHTAHFATCPAAKRWSKKGKA